MLHTILPIFNFFVFIGIIAYFTRKPIGEFVRGRHDTIRDELKRVEHQFADAKKKFADFDSKLKAVDAEIRSIKDQTRMDSEATRNRIVNDSKRLASNIVSESQTSAQAGFADMKTQLRIEVGMMILDSAEKIIAQKLTTDTRVKIRKAFSQEVSQQVEHRA
jgi:F0F1-type ATP synthase membrane subunit b/b'